MSKKIHDKIKKTFDKCILDQVSKILPHTRKHIYSDEYCLSMFKFMLNDTVKWSSLTIASDYNKKNTYHYKYLNAVYNKWSRKNIFKKAYIEMIQTEYFKLKHIKKSDTINLFIDCSFMSNMYGSDCKATNPEYKKKKFTKLSAICDEENNIISLIYDKTHLSKRQNPAFSHDITLAQPTLDEMFINLKSNNTAKLCGDKGYISTQKFKLNNKKEIKIIAPKRENQKTKNTPEDEALLKKRSTIERCFAPLKKYSRVCIRRDQNIANYMNFVYFALLDMFYKKNIINANSSK